MTLHKYLQRDDAPTLSSLAASVGVSVGRLSQLRRSIDWPPLLALKLEQVTNGQINAGGLSEVVAQCRKVAA